MHAIYLRPARQRQRRQPKILYNCVHSQMKNSYSHEPRQNRTTGDSPCQSLRLLRGSKAGGESGLGAGALLEAAEPAREPREARGGEQVGVGRLEVAGDGEEENVSPTEVAEDERGVRELELLLGVGDHALEEHKDLLSSLERVQEGSGDVLLAGAVVAERKEGLHVAVLDDRLDAGHDQGANLVNLDARESDISVVALVRADGRREEGAVRGVLHVLRGEDLVKVASNGESLEQRNPVASRVDGVGALR